MEASQADQVTGTYCLRKRSRKCFVAFQKAAEAAGIQLPSLYANYWPGKTEKEERRVKVMFLDSMGIQDCVPMIGESISEKMNHLVFVCEYCTVSCQQIVDRLTLHPQSPLRHLLYEIMDTSLFLQDFLSHKYIQRAYPEEIYSPCTTQRKLQELKIEAHQALQYVPRDPIVRYYGLRPGQMIRIRRFGEPSGDEVVYRMLN